MNSVNLQTADTCLLMHMPYIHIHTHEVQIRTMCGIFSSLSANESAGLLQITQFLC